MRHLSLLCKSDHPDVSAAKLEESYMYRKLRSFMLFCHINPLPQTFFELKIFSELFENFKRLRVLNLSCNGLHKLSDCIESFRYLHYLNLSNTSITKLPKSIGNLCGLETLQLEECLWTCKLVKELEKMNCLRGSISIKDFENVADSQEAQVAKLRDKQFLEKLELHWNGTSTHEAEVLERLEPHYRLKELQVNNYHGLGFPGWICMPPSINVPARQIEKLVLHSCPELVKLPSLHHLTSLEELEIYCCPLVSLTVAGLHGSLKKVEHFAEWHLKAAVHGGRQ